MLKCKKELPPKTTQKINYVKEKQDQMEKALNSQSKNELNSLIT